MSSVAPFSSGCRGATGIAVRLADGPLGLQLEYAIEETRLASGARRR